MATTTLADVRDWDKRDTLRAAHDAFVLPDGVICLDGTSLGTRPHVTGKASAVTECEWGNGLTRSREAADWMAAPARTAQKSPHHERRSGRNDYPRQHHH
jgi:kynureninase